MSGDFSLLIESHKQMIRELEAYRVFAHKISYLLSNEFGERNEVPDLESEVEQHLELLDKRLAGEITLNEQLLGYQSHQPLAS